MKHQKGFTLVELLVTLGLAGIIISIVMSFFIANIKSYETINTESELQYQSQYTINFMTNKILYAKSYEGILGNKATFKYDMGKTFSFEKDGNVIKFKNEGEPVIEICDNVEEFTVSTLSGGKGVVIKLVLKKGNSKPYEVFQTVHMRNS